MIANDDKRITQFNIVQEIGQLNGYPEIAGTKHTLGQKKSKMLSGKYSISESVGSFEFELSLDLENDQHDIDIYEQNLRNDLQKIKSELGDEIDDSHDGATEVI